jgi:hypothetical protein
MTKIAGPDPHPNPNHCFLYLSNLARSCADQIYLSTHPLRLYLDCVGDGLDLPGDGGRPGGLVQEDPARGHGLAEPHLTRSSGQLKIQEQLLKQKPKHSGADPRIRLDE